MSSLASLLHDSYRVRRDNIIYSPRSIPTHSPIFHRHPQAYSSVHILRSTFMLASIDSNILTPGPELDLPCPTFVLNTAWNYFDVLRLPSSPLQTQFKTDRTTMMLSFIDAEHGLFLNKPSPLWFSDRHIIILGVSCGNVANNDPDFLFRFTFQALCSTLFLFIRFKWENVWV